MSVIRVSEQIIRMFILLRWSDMWCCCPCGSEDPIVATCPDCGGGIDEDGYTDNACEYSPVECKTCGYAPCDGSC